MLEPSPTVAKAAVPAAFDRAARTYDLLCTLNPGYRGDLAKSARRLALGPGANIVDLCCGTGISTTALRRTYPQADLIGLDASPQMIAAARRKSGLAGVRFVVGDAMDPGAAGVEGPADGILMAYGIRNVVDPDLCLARVREILRPGGVICFHEYSVADSKVAAAVWRAVCASIIIPLGRALSDAADLYRYLRASVLAFDGVRAFEARLRRAGFVDIKTLPMGGWQRGILHSFMATRPR
ncbi:MAG TPA: class I SAM-dependent methyltransferase [Kofleriaceae bacterium]|nr:class I SAM-dependent methyltransferase [Kofleriaceae bacterium]